MSKDPKVSNIQIRGLIVSTVIGVQIFTLPNSLMTLMGRDGWMAILLSGLLMIPAVVIINKIFQDNPNKDYSQIGEETLGKVVFTICQIIYFVYFLIFAAFVSRTLGELVKAFLLPTTPIEIIIISFIVVCSYIAIYEIDAIVRAGYFIYPVIIGFVVLLIVLSIPESDFTNVLPVFQMDLAQIPKGVQTAFLSFAGFEFALFALPYVEDKDKDKVLKSSILAVVIITLVYLSLFIITISHFSTQQIERQVFPVLILAKLIDLPGYFLQNLDGVFMAIWVLVVFATMSPAYFGAGKALSKIVKAKTHKYIVWGLIPVIYLIALWTENIAELYLTLGRLINILGFISIAVIPILVFTVGRVRRRLKK